MPTSFNRHGKDDYTIVKETWKDEFERYFRPFDIYMGEQRMSKDVFHKFIETQIKKATKKVPFEIYEEISNRIAKTNTDSPRYWELRSLLDFIILFEKENS